MSRNDTANLQYNQSETPCRLKAAEGTEQKLECQARVGIQGS